MNAFSRGDLTCSESQFVQLCNALGGDLDSRADYHLCRDGDHDSARSGPFCQSGCVGYPYTDVAAYVPRDYLWMYPAIVLALLIIVLVHGILDQINPNRRVLSGIAVTLTGLGAGALIIDYGIQLAYLQPNWAKPGAHFRSRSWRGTGWEFAASIGFPEKLTPALHNQPDTPVLGAAGVNFSGIHN